MRLRLPFFLAGLFAAMGLMTSLGMDVFNDFAWLIQVKRLLFQLTDAAFDLVKGLAVGRISRYLLMTHLS